MDAPEERLVALGVAAPTATGLVRRYGTERVVDALDAGELLGDGTLRRRAVWVVAAISQGWDLQDAVAERRQVAARYVRWERERAARDREAARWSARETAAGVWRGAISGALDDDQLAVAVARNTQPVSGLNRRSVPMARVQLLAWAVAVHLEAPTVPLRDALAADLAGPARTPAPEALAGALPAVPGDHTDLEDDLTARLTGLLARRPDLTRVEPPAPAVRRLTGRAAEPLTHDW